MSFDVIQQISFCYGHRLLNYVGKCAHLHGHNAIAEIKLTTEKLNATGMVLDFNEIKSKMKLWVEDQLDHKLLLQKGDSLIEILQKQGEPIFIMEGNPTAENIAKLIFDQGFEQGLPVTEVKLWETPTQAALYRK